MIRIIFGAVFAAAVSAAAGQAVEPTAYPAPTSGNAIVFPGAAATETGKPGWDLPGVNYQAGEGWLALVCGKTCALQTVNMRTQAITKHPYDSEPVPGQRITFVPWGDKLPLVWINSVTSDLHAGSVVTWLHRGMARYPKPATAGAMEIQIPVPDQAAAMLVPQLVRESVSADGAPVPEHVAVELRIGNQRQTLSKMFQGIGGWADIARGKQLLLWAGDMDGDGKLDLLLAPNGGDGSSMQLYLSSMAGEGQIVGLAGEFNYFPVESSGCE
jgi:hypothetical protein